MSTSTMAKSKSTSTSETQTRAVISCPCPILNTIRETASLRTMRSNPSLKRRKTGIIERMAKVTVQMSNLSMSSATAIQKFRMRASYKSMLSNKARTPAWDSWSPTRSPHSMTSTSSITIVRRRATRAHLRITISSITSSSTSGHPRAANITTNTSSSNSYNPIESRCSRTSWVPRLTI